MNRITLSGTFDSRVMNCVSLTLLLTILILYNRQLHLCIFLFCLIVVIVTEYTHLTLSPRKSLSVQKRLGTI